MKRTWRKGFRFFIVSFTLLTLLPGCGLIGWVYRPVSWNQDKIMRGMTEEEVEKVMGKYDTWWRYKPGVSITWVYRQRCRIGTTGTTVGDSGYCEGNILNDFTKLLVYGLGTLTLLWWLPRNEKDFEVDFDGGGRVVSTEWSFAAYPKRQ